MLKELHERYGQLTIQLKIIQGQLLEVEKRIVDEMNKPITQEETKKDAV